MKSLFSHFSKKEIPLLCIIWAAVLTGLCYLPSHFVSPVTAGLSVTANHPRSALLQPGDVLTEEFNLTGVTLNTLSFAFDYDPDDAADTQVLVSVFYAGSMIMEQELPISAITPGSLVAFAADSTSSLQDSCLIQITNTSELPGSVFSVLYTETPIPSGTAFSDFSINGRTESGRILCDIQYTEGYHIYPAVCVIFCLCLTGLILSVLLCRFPHRK